MTEQKEALTADWIDIAVTRRGGALVIDADSFFIEFLEGCYFEDNFAGDPPDHLPAGAYRWSGFKVGYWDEDEAMNVTGGTFTALQPVAVPGELVAMREALAGLLDHYVQLVTSGDAGFWNPEKEEIVIAARKALTSTPPVDEMS